MTSPLGPIHLIADLDVLLWTKEPHARVVALLEAGLPSLTLRGPGRTVAELVQAGSKLRAVARDHGALFVVNGPLEAARQLDADALHCPAAAAPPPSTSPLPWGRSVHDARELTAAAGARWVFLSPVYPTDSHPGGAALGLERFTELAAATDIPVYALGGVDRSRAPDCRRAGAAGVAAVRALLDPDGPDWVRREMASARSDA